MSSSVFFKFKSSKEVRKITFDGTGISVFELKREIISLSQMGNGSDFDLAIYSDDSNEEYDDDTTIIPRSTTVIARRSPATKSGHGKAARYVSGQAPIMAKNAYRTEASQKQGGANASAGNNGFAEMNNAMTEEDKIAAMFKADATQWEQQKQHMANAKPVYHGKFKGRQANVPDHDPPPGYICYRCHEKGHWIQACPTNDDPTFEAKPKIKRTTGIPNSFLKTVEKPVAVANDGFTDDRQPTGVMINAKGEYVVAEPDKASWEQFQAKAKASKEEQSLADNGNKELQDRGLECPIDKRLFVDPMKTPCCGKTYCNECIENALVDSDLTCPNCGTTGVLIDNLATDEEMKAKIKAYEEERAAEQKAKQSPKSPKPASPVEPSMDAKTDTKPDQQRSATPSKSASNSPVAAPVQPTGPASPKKRPAEEELKNDRIPTGPAAMRKTNSQQSQKAPNGIDDEFFKTMNNLTGITMPPNGQFPPAFSGFPNMNGNMNGMQFPNTMMGMPPMMPGMMNQMNQMMPNGNWGWGMNGMAGNQQMQNGMGRGGGFANQQKTVFSEPFPNEEDNAYMRRPVNPHRHQNRQRRVRPSDYTEL
ncbi:DWNN-domain-containing protein [Rhizodiscina lignyota]|uniref:DWNN-domain-containing protein n=1 Tax=Rhizodiscina lignyota TaxID=1504668 RepID=A0A9P4II09_9PEZI|nr:DWNN-domain-containing protein [Rhizodiscina lignyota]